MQQLELFSTTTTRKSIVTVPVDQLRVSRFNPRRTRPTADVATLAERMQRNGFEITRALWATKNHEGYEVFAGGTRLEAARVAGLSSIPIVLHEGFTDEQIVGLADEDNENDEYHRPVSVVDMWLSYKALADQGWTQQRIAEAKGVSQAQVAKRSNYANFPIAVLDRFIQNNLLAESHAAEINRIIQSEYLSNWITHEQAMIEVIDTVLAKIAKTQAPTAKQFESAVSEMNAILTAANDLYVQLAEPWASAFIAVLAQRGARTRAEVQSAFSEINRQKLTEARRAEEELARQRDQAEAERLRLEHEAERAAAIEASLAKVHHGDARTLAITAPQNIQLVLTDPPYGQDFQSNRRVISAKADKIQNDDGLDKALDLLYDVLGGLYDRMSDNSTALIWCRWKEEPEFRKTIESVGLTIKGSLIWNKPNHGTGDLEGSFAPKHERIIHAVKGAPKLRRRLDDVLNGSVFLGSAHPTEKPVDLLQELIKATTDEGDCIADPFAGAGSTIIAAHATRRNFWACELEKHWHQVATNALYEQITQEA